MSIDTQRRNLQVRQPELREIVDEVLSMLEARLQSEGVSAAVDVPEGLAIAESRPMRLAVFQLIAHALECMPGGGDLLVGAFVDGDTLELEVADSGRGTDDRRFLLSDPLNVVRRLAAKLGGSVALVNCAQGGAARILRVPRGQSSRAVA